MRGQTMHFGVLGPVVATGPTGPLTLGPPKQRLLLAVLLARTGTMITTDELVDALWGESPPSSARGNLRTYVHQLRRLIGADRLTGAGRSGFTVLADAGELDAAEATDLVGTGLAALAAGDVDDGATRLRQALALWRGEPFAGLDDTPVLAGEVARLRELRLTALEHRIGADLDRGHDTGLTAELTDLVRENPYREHFAAQLMIVLHRTGRRAEALATYRSLRDRLADDLGIEPGPDVRALHAAILRDDVALDLPDTAERRATGVVPAELPAAAGHFVGRDPELRRLTEVATATAAPGVPAVVAVVGPAGVGKTALALHWAHRAAGRYPDGQLFSDLRGFHRLPAADPCGVVARFLRALGVPPHRVPADADEASALYRSLLSGRRMLVLLDNAADAAQVRPLLPGAGGCTVVVTSRNRLPGLVSGGGGGTELAVRPMPADDAVEVLAAVLGAARTDAEPGAAAELATACGHLPLALRVAAAGLAARPERSVTDHVALMRGGDRLDALTISGDAELAVRPAFDLSYRALNPARQRLFRLVGLIPGADFAAPAAAALADAPVAATRRDLDRLVDVHLVEPSGPDRYRLHDLVREYAAGLARDEAQALDRLYDHYLTRADSASRALYPHLLRLPTEDTPADLDPADALAWFAAEHTNVAAAARLAAGPFSWRLADALRGYWSSRRSNVEWPQTVTAAAAAAEAAGDLWALAAMEMSLAHFHTFTRDYPGALAHGRRARDLCVRIGWQRGEATALGNLCAALGDAGDLGRTVNLLREALAVHRRTGWRPGESTVLSNLGMTYQNLGRLAEAETALTGALSLARRAPVLLSSQAVALINLAEVYLLTDRRDEADVAIGEAESTGRAIDRIDIEIYALVLRSELRRVSGDPEVALELAAAALRKAIGTDNRLVSLAHGVAGAAQTRLGRHWSAVAHRRRACRLVRQTHSRYFRIEAFIGLAGALRPVDPENPEEAAAIAERSAADAHTHGYGVLEGMAHAVLAEIEAGRGNPTAAHDHARRVREIQHRTGWRRPVF